MKTLALISATIAGLSLSGCFQDGGYFGPPPPGPAPVAGYEGWYDGYYGPIFDGYWSGASFYYRDYDGGRWLRDRGHHFRHDAAPGFHRIEGHVRAPPRQPRR